MAYIGSRPDNVVSRQSSKTYRYTATAGQTVFSGADQDNQILAITPSDAEVHMNGLMLDPSDYTLTGTSVTLSTAATAGDELTVTGRQTFEVADTYTKTAADSRYVNTTGDTMTGTLDVDASVFGRSFEFRAGSNALTHGVAVHSTVANALQFNTQSVERMRIDEYGRVTMPYQVGFLARRSIAGDNRSGGAQEWAVSGVGSYNQGSNFNTSNGRFTAPLSGKYYFSSAPGYKQTGIDFNFYFQVNGVNVAEPVRYVNISSGNHSTASGSMVLHLNAGDYVSIYMYYTHHANVDLNYFSGHLIG